MRHKKNFNHLGRKRGHRKAMLSNMASSLIIHKRIKTTVAKAKALKSVVEPLITKAKDDTTHARREGQGMYAARGFLGKVATIYLCQQHQ